MEKVLIFGNGYVAGKFASYLSSIPANQRPEFEITGADIADAVAVRQAISSFSPTVVINCAGKTGRPNIDWCEDSSFDPARGQTWLDSNQGLTWRSNVLGPQIMASCCIKENVFFVHVGSGCVYSGDNSGNGFAEDDPPNFTGSFYSKTKIASEQALKLMSEHLISENNQGGFIKKAEMPAGILQLRLRMPLDSEPSPRNFITKITAYKKVISVSNSISVMHDFVRASWALIGMRAQGIYNVTNPGLITHAEILDMYKGIVDPNFSYTLMSVDELHSITTAKRSNCVLSSAKILARLKHTNVSMPPVKEAVRAALVEYKQQLVKSDSDL